jgi:hypothetical protein
MIPRVMCARKLAKLFEHLPMFYYLEAKQGMHKIELNVIRLDPETNTPQVWGKVRHDLIDEPTIEWLPGCPPPQFALVPAPPPDLTNEVEFPDEKLRRIDEKILAELSRRDRARPLPPWPEHRCRVCGWPLKATIQEGCVPGNCSQRPLPTRRADVGFAPEDTATGTIKT